MLSINRLIKLGLSNASFNISHWWRPVFLSKIDFIPEIMYVVRKNKDNSHRTSCKKLRKCLQLCSYKLHWFFLEQFTYLILAKYHLSLVLTGDAWWSLFTFIIFLISKFCFFCWRERFVTKILTVRACNLILALFRLTLASGIALASTCVAREDHQALQKAVYTCILPSSDSQALRIPSRT